MKVFVIGAAGLIGLPAIRANTDALDAWVGFKPDTPVKLGVARFVAWYREYNKV